MAEFKIGQTVKRVKGGYNDGIDVGDEAKIIEISVSGNVRLDKGTQPNWHDPSNLQIVDDLTNKNKMSNVVDKIKLARMQEPDKTLVKAGLMNLDGSLTSQGTEALNDLLTQEYKEKLKTDYALPILAEEEKD